MDNKTVSLSKTLIEACSEIMNMFEISSSIAAETQENNFETKRYVYIAIGLTHGLSGTILFGLSKDFAWKLMSHMMGGMEITELDSIAQSCLCEFTNMLAGSALIKLNSAELIDLQLPILKINEAEETQIISDNPSVKLIFEINDADFHINNSKFDISYCLH
jgi:CheY-specific phosphatase CheX